MNGILTATPGTSAVRLLVGTHLLLLIEGALVIGSHAVDDTGLWLIVLVSWVIGLAALITAVRGEGKVADTPWWRRRHGA